MLQTSKMIFTLIGIRNFSYVMENLVSHVHSARAHLDENSTRHTHLN